MELNKIYKMMAGIKPGDKIDFNSYGACDSAIRLGRSNSSTIPAIGTVLKVYPRYVLVNLKVAREGVHWGSIKKVNGIGWPLYRKEMA
ncbi:MAG: hypothetical protein J6N51_01860 [Selenomonas sp.]|nr:hypothetical protein [Selenomonas sp.]